MHSLIYVTNLLLHLPILHLWLNYTAISLKISIPARILSMVIFQLKRERKLPTVIQYYYCDVSVRD